MGILDEMLTGGRSRGTRGFAAMHGSLGELDPSLAALFRDQIRPKERIRHIISAPSQTVLEKREGFQLWMRWIATTACTLVLTDQRLLVVAVEQPDASPDLYIIPLADILSMELGKILLYAWLDWSWAADGEVRRLRMFFNTVGENLFHQVVSDICRSRIELASLRPAKTGRNLAALEDLPYKFKNIIAGRLLLPDEAVQGLVFRGAIWDSVLGVFKRMIAPAQALLLTNYHILVMREDLGHAGSKYGVIFRFFPLDGVSEAGLIQDGSQVRLDVLLCCNGAQEDVMMLFNEEERQPLIAMLSRWMQ